MKNPRQMAFLNTLITGSPIGKNLFPIEIKRLLEKCVLKTVKEAEKEYVFE